MRLKVQFIIRTIFFGLIASVMVTLFAYYRFSVEPPWLYLLSVSVFAVWISPNIRNMRESLEMEQMEREFKEA